MKTPLTICAFIALSSIANAQQPAQDSNAKKEAPVPQAPAASGTSNSGDVDTSVPKVDHGIQKTATDAKEHKNHATEPEGKENMKPKADKTDASDKDQSKVIDRDHGTSKINHQEPKDGTDTTKDVRKEDKSKNDKITDHEYGTEKTKN